LRDPKDAMEFFASEGKGGFAGKGFMDTGIGSLWVVGVGFAWLAEAAL